MKMKNKIEATYNARRKGPDANSFLQRAGGAAPKQILILISTAFFISGCNFAPTYHTPSMATPTAYKEGTSTSNDTNIWKPADPKDGALRDNWWELFGDATLNKYELQVNVSNQSIALAEANYRVAHALVKEARAQYFPTIGIDPSATRARGSRNIGGSSGHAANDFALPIDATWEPDLWGRIANTVKAAKYEAQATQADLESMRLSIRAELAADYFELRALDAQRKLLDDTVAAYQKSLDLTNVRAKTGISSDEDVAQAQSQLDTVRAQATDIGVMRAQLEHAIAMLLGLPASSFSLAEAPFVATAPAVPLGTPSQLLERRPDVAAAERRVAEANAQIGVARAAYFPAISLGASAGLESTMLSNIISAPSLAWSLGGSASQTLFDGGLNFAVAEQARAAYDATVATYRQTVLSAFQNVEDNLAAVRILSQENAQEQSAVKSSERFLTLATQRYQMGIDSYLNVLTAQTTLLGNQRTALNVQMEELTAAVQLIKALGGGWEK